MRLLPWLRLFRRVVFSAVAVTTIVLVLSGLYVSTIGFPRRIVEYCLDHMETPDLALDVGRIRLDLRHGLTVEEIRLYRKRTIEPFLIKADTAYVSINPFARMWHSMIVSGIELHDGVIFAGLLNTGEGGRPRELALRGEIQVGLRDCEFEQVAIENLACTVCMGEGKVRCADLRGTLKRREWEGGLSGDLVYDSRDGSLSGSFVTTLDPHLILPAAELLRATFFCELVRRFQFKGMPRCELDLRGHLGDVREIRLEADCWLPESVYQGVDILRADGKVHFVWRPTQTDVDIDPFLVVRNEGIVRGNVSVTPATGAVAFRGVSTVDPKALVRMIGILGEPFQRSARFEGPTTIEAEGRTNLRDAKEADYVVGVWGRRMGLNNLVVDECSFTLERKGNSLRTTNLDGAMYGGRLGGSVALEMPAGEATNATYDLALHLENAEFEQFVKDWVDHPKDGLTGTLRIDLAASGDLGDAISSAKGKGKIRIDNGRVFMLPLFGGFSDAITKVIPGLDFVLRQGDAKADFTIEDRTMHFKDARILGDVLSLSANGTCDFDSNVDFNVQVRLMKDKTALDKLVRGLTSPISKLLEFRLTGTLAKPRWEAFQFPAEMLEHVGIGGSTPAAGSGNSTEKEPEKNGSVEDSSR